MATSDTKAQEDEGDVVVPFVSLETRNQELIDPLPMQVYVRFNRNVQSGTNDIQLFLTELQNAFNRKREFFILYDAIAVTSTSRKELSIMDDFLSKNESLSNRYCKGCAIVIDNQIVLGLVKTAVFFQKKPPFPLKFESKVPKAKEWLKKVQDLFVKKAD